MPQATAPLSARARMEAFLARSTELEDAAEMIDALLQIVEQGYLRRDGAEAPRHVLRTGEDGGRIVGQRGILLARERLQEAVSNLRAEHARVGEEEVEECPKSQ